MLCIRKVGTLLMTIVLITVSCSGDNTSTPEFFAKTIAKAIVNQDKNLVKSLVFTHGDLLVITKLLLKAAETNSQYASHFSMIKRRLTFLATQRAHKRYIESANTIIDSLGQLLLNAKKEGVDLGNAVYGGLLDLKYKEIMGVMRVYVVRFYVVVKDTKYVIRVAEVIKTSSGFRLTEGLKWQGVK